MRSSDSGLQNNLWVTLVATPVLLAIVPEVILWWWPSAPALWSPVAAAAIGVMANIAFAFGIGKLRQYFEGRNSGESPEISGATPGHEDHLGPQRSILQVINLGAGISASVTMIIALILVFGPQLWGRPDDADNPKTDPSASQVAPAPTFAASSELPVPAELLTPTPLVSADLLIDAAESAGAGSAQDNSALKAARILANRGQYGDAINTAMTSGSRSGRTEALTLVSHTAIENGEYIHALSAAGKMHYASDQDRVELDILCAIKKAISTMPQIPTTTFLDANDRFPSFSQMRESALSDGSRSGRDRVLDKVVAIAVLLGDYENAVESAVAMHWATNRLDAFTFVARCAAEERLFRIAFSAAQKIDNRYDKARVTEGVMNAIELTESEPYSAITDPPSTSCRGYLLQSR